MLLHIRHHVRRVPRMQYSRTAIRPLRIRLAIIGHPLIHLRREPDHLRRNIINQHRPIDPAPVQIRRNAFGDRQNSTIVSQFWRFFFISSSAVSA